MNSMEVATDMVVKSTCGLCGIGCGILVHIRNGRVVQIEGDPNHPLNEGVLCTKGLSSLEYLYHPNRLKYPLKRLGNRGEDKWQTISWDEAIEVIADELTKAKDKYGAESVAFIRGSHKGGFKGEYLSPFASAFGSPNIAWQGHVCFVPRSDASALTYGYYAIPDFEYPPASITIWGNNLPENLHHVHRRVTRAVENGAKMMVVDPRNVGGADRAELWIKPRPSSDLSLALGMLNVIINERLYDEAFVNQWTVGFDELRTHVQDYTPERVADLTWVQADVIRQAAKFYGTNKPACLQWGNAIDHGVNSFQSARAICILRAITGNLEVPGGELRWLPVPLSKSISSGLSLGDKLSPGVKQQRIARSRLLPIRPDVPPQDIINAILYEDPGAIRAAYVQGCNPLLTYPNALEVRKALLSLDFLVVVDMFMTPTTALADVVLPVTTYLESDDVIAPPYSIPVASVQQQVIRIGECRSDYEILRDIARKLGIAEQWNTNYHSLDSILAPCGISFEEFKKVGLLSGSRQYRSYQLKGFPTPSGKVELYSDQLKQWGFDPLPTYCEPPETPLSTPDLISEYPLVFTSGKLGCYRHSGGRQIASLRGSHPEPVTYIHPQAAERIGIANGDWVYVETRRGKIRQRAMLSSDIDPRVIVIDYAWWFPEDDDADLYGWAKSNLNILTDDKPPFNQEMGSSNLRGMICKIRKASG